jgi:1-acyl-sn-glycerol-3-phosphate acyltransferase
MVWRISNQVILNPIKKIFVKEVIGIENMPKYPPFIIASNHASYLDTFIIIKIVYDKFRQKTHYVSHPGRFGRRLPEFIYLKYAGCIPTDVPEEEFFANVKNALKDKIVAVFPEGGYTKDGSIRQFKSGVGKMALESSVQILPVALQGTYDVCPGPKLIPKFKKIVKVVIGKPINCDRHKNEKSLMKAYRGIASEVEAEVKKLFNA